MTFAAGRQFGTVLVDPPWRFANRTGKMAPEHKRLSRYVTLSMEEIAALPVGSIVVPTAHLYLWVPNALLPFGLRIMEAWGFEYKTNIVWHKLRKDGGSDGRGVGFYFRNVTEMIFWRSREERATLSPGRRQVNYIGTRKRDTAESPMNSTTSSKPARLDHILNCSREGHEGDGRLGGTKPMTVTSLHGRPTPTTHAPSSSPQLNPQLGRAVCPYDAVSSV